MEPTADCAFSLSFQFVCAPKSLVGGGSSRIVSRLLMFDAFKEALREAFSFFFSCGVLRECRAEQVSYHLFGFCCRQEICSTAMRVSSDESAPVAAHAFWQWP
jgi:hypothetical protein